MSDEELQQALEERGIEPEPIRPEDVAVERIDPELALAADFVPYERVEIYNVTNGERFDTYAIEGERGKGEICVNGAAAHRVGTHDRNTSPGETENPRRKESTGSGLRRSIDSIQRPDLVMALRPSQGRAAWAAVPKNVMSALTEPRHPSWS